jgi:hypothetical protein
VFFVFVYKIFCFPFFCSSGEACLSFECVVCVVLVAKKKKKRIEFSLSTG